MSTYFLFSLKLFKSFLLHEFVVISSFRCKGFTLLGFFRLTSHPSLGFLGFPAYSVSLCLINSSSLLSYIFHPPLFFFSLLMVEFWWYNVSATCVAHNVDSLIFHGKESFGDSKDYLFHSFFWLLLWQSLWSLMPHLLNCVSIDPLFLLLPMVPDQLSSQIFFLESSFLGCRNVCFFICFKSSHFIFQ